MKYEKGDVIPITCRHCGNEFLYEYRGGKTPIYCDDCREATHKEYQAKYYLSRTKLRRAAKKVETQQEEVKAPTNSYEQRVYEMFGELDSLRVRMCELSKELSQYQSGYDKSDQSFMHKLEGLDVDNEEVVYEFIKSWKSDRNSRRNVKNLILILREVIESIPIKNKANAIRFIRRQGNTRFSTLGEQQEELVE